MIVFPLDDENEDCGDPSPGPPDEPPTNDPDKLADWTSGFYESQQEWLTRTANLPNITDSLQLMAEKDTILFLRLDMNKNASLLLQQYSLDTTVIEVDSIIAWLDRAETYTADLQLSRNYFFRGDLTSFDALWPTLPTKYSLAGNQLDDYNELTIIFALVRPSVQAGIDMHRLPQQVTDSLDYWSRWCSEPGFLAQSLLWRNGIHRESDCSGGVGGRSQQEGPAAQELNRNGVLFRIYPNPADQAITIEPNGGSMAGVVSMFDLRGNRVVKEAWPVGTPSMRLDTSGLAPGIYFVEIRSSAGTSKREKVLLLH